MAKKTLLEKLVAERKALNNKLTKLDKVIAEQQGGEVVDYQGNLLVQQSRAMASYLDILDKRIEMSGMPF